MTSQKDFDTAVQGMLAELSAPEAALPVDSASDPHSAPSACAAPPAVTVIRPDGTRVAVNGAEPSPTVQRYSPIGMVEFLIANPGMPLRDIASSYGRTLGWLSTVVASDAFQRALDPRRVEVTDPFFTATMDERFRALALRSGHILLNKLDAPDASDHLVLKATELSIKALGMGIAPPEPAEPAERKLTVAEKMQAAMEAMDARQAARTLDMTLTEVKDE